MTQAASLTCMMEGNGDKTDNMYVCFFRIWHDSQHNEEKIHIFVVEWIFYHHFHWAWNCTDRTQLKKKRGLCLRNGCNENVDFNHVSPDYMYVKRVACGDKPTDNYPLKSAVYVSSTLAAVAASLLNAASGRLHKGAFRRRGWRRTKQSWKRSECSWPQVERSTSPNEF